MLDMFAHPSVFGSIHMGMETLERFIELLNLDRLIRYALQYEVGALIKRLGWTLETLGVPDSMVEPLRGFPVSNVSRLDPAGPASGPIVPRWQVRCNLLA